MAGLLDELAAWELFPPRSESHQVCPCLQEPEPCVVPRPPPEGVCASVLEGTETVTDDASPEETEDDVDSSLHEICEEVCEDESPEADEDEKDELESSDEEASEETDDEEELHAKLSEEDDSWNTELSLLASLDEESSTAAADRSGKAVKRRMARLVRM